MKKLVATRWIGGAVLGALVGLTVVAIGAFTAPGVSPSDIATLKSDKEALQQQLASMAPTMVVQAGQLAPPPLTAQPSGWDTPESVRGRIRLFATYDSSGPDAWDVRAHPMVFITSEGVGSNPKGGTRKSGVQVIDAHAKKVIASALFDLGEEVVENPHGVGISPDGRWLYIGQMHRLKATGQVRTVLMIINARTLKLHMVLEGPRVDWFHHIIAFKDWMGRDRVLLAFGRGANGGPHFILDPNDNNRVVRAITIEDIGYKIGHPYLTVDPTGRFVYVSVVSPPWRTQLHNTGGIAKVNLETGAVTIVPYVGEHPIGMAHTADGRYTYVNDAHGSNVYKIDNTTNSVVSNTSAGVVGPYGLVLNWDETLLYPIGKGEGAHNIGSVVGVVDAVAFGPPRRMFLNLPIYLGGSASSIDHGVLHPDPKVNELWISNMNGWEIIVLDLNTHKVKAYIPTPNGGDTHSGGFVRYTPDWKGELLADMGGPKVAMREMMRQRAAARPAAAPASTPAAAASAAAGPMSGRLIFEKTAGGIGCAACHGMNGRGGAQFNAPDIRGADETRVRSALAGVAQMSQIRLTDAEITAVVAHLQELNKQP
ncbi:MAG: c-type cytochrome [Acidobacteria bacterium]|nr:c-type cytochrome [Acidobacteriota bacterium]